MLIKRLVGLTFNSSSYRVWHFSTTGSRLGKRTFVSAKFLENIRLELTKSRSSVSQLQKSKELEESEALKQNSGFETVKSEAIQMLDFRKPLSGPSQFEHDLAEQANKMKNKICQQQPNNWFLQTSLKGGIISFLQNEAKLILSTIEKLEGSDHPLLNYVKLDNLGSLEQSDIFKYSSLLSSIVLLVANSFDFSRKLVSQGNPTLLETAKAEQTTLAEITELIYAAHMLHRTVVEIAKGQLPTLGENGSTELPKSKGASLHHGNKIATLVGDLLLARSSKGLFSLKNPTVTELMSNSIADIQESEVIVLNTRVSFLSLRTNCVSNPILLNKQPGDSVIFNYDKWLKRSSLSTGSLLQNACYGSLVFGGHDKEVSVLASKIGHTIGLVLDAYRDYATFYKDNNPLDLCDLCSLPVVFQLEKYPNLISKMPDNHQMFEEIRASPYAIARTRETLLRFMEEAFRLIHNSSLSNHSSKLLKEFLTSLSS